MATAGSTSTTAVRLSTGHTGTGTVTFFVQF